METVNLLISMTSLILAYVALRRAELAEQAVARFREKSRRLDVVNNLRDAIAMTRELSASAGRRFSQQRCDSLRELLVGVCHSSVIDKPAKGRLRIAIDQVRQAPENSRDAKSMMRELEEDLMELAALLHNRVEDEL